MIACGAHGAGEGSGLGFEVRAELEEVALELGGVGALVVGDELRDGGLGWTERAGSGERCLSLTAAK